MKSKAPSAGGNVRDLCGLCGAAVALLATACSDGMELTAVETQVATEQSAVVETYEATPLDTLGGDSQASLINARGEVFGVSATSEGVDHAVGWKNGKVFDLGVLGDAGNASEAVAVNDRGQVVGYSGPRYEAGHAFLWESGVMRDLGTLGGDASFAAAINNRGEVVGSATDSAGIPRAVLWKDRVALDLGTLGGRASGASAINDRGQVVGSSDTAAADHVHAFIWEHGVMTQLDELDEVSAINLRGEVLGWIDSGDSALWRQGSSTEFGSGAFASALGNRGGVVGEALNAAGKRTAFSFKNGTLLDLGWLGSESCRYCSSASALNERGQIVGSALTASNEVHAFVWDHGTMTDLGEPGKTSWALAINERGDIVGVQRPNPTGSWQGVLWTRRCHSR